MAENNNNNDLVLSILTEYDDVLLQIMSFLDLDELLNASYVCKFWNRVAKDSDVERIALNRVYKSAQQDNSSLQKKLQRMFLYRSKLKQLTVDMIHLISAGIQNSEQEDELRSFVRKGILPNNRVWINPFQQQDDLVLAFKVYNSWTTPFHVACYFRCMKALQLYLKFHADHLNYVDADGYGHKPIELVSGWSEGLSWFLQNARKDLFPSATHIERVIRQGIDLELLEKLLDHVYKHSRDLRRVRLTLKNCLPWLPAEAVQVIKKSKLDVESAI